MRTNASPAWIAIEPTPGTLRKHLRSTDRSLLLATRGADLYHHPLIATDLEHAASVLPALRMCHAAARLAVISVYRIPFHSHRVLIRKAAVEAAIQRATRERLESFVATSAIDRVRFDLIAKLGNWEDHVAHEIESRGVDLFILAMTPRSLSTRRSARLLEPIVNSESCDVIVLRDHVRSCVREPELMPPVPG